MSAKRFYQNKHQQRSIQDQKNHYFGQKDAKNDYALSKLNSDTKAPVAAAVAVNSGKNEISQIDIQQMYETTDVKTNPMDIQNRKTFKSFYDNRDRKYGVKKYGFRKTAEASEFDNEYPHRNFVLPEWANRNIRCSSCHGCFEYFDKQTGSPQSSPGQAPSLNEYNDDDHDENGDDDSKDVKDSTTLPGGLSGLLADDSKNVKDSTTLSGLTELLASNATPKKGGGGVYTFVRHSATCPEVTVKCGSCSFRQAKSRMDINHLFDGSPKQCRKCYKCEVCMELFKRDRQGKMIPHKCKGLIQCPTCSETIAWNQIHAIFCPKTTVNCKYCGIDQFAEFIHLHYAVCTGLKWCDDCNAYTSSGPYHYCSDRYCNDCSASFDYWTLGHNSILTSRKTERGAVPSNLILDFMDPMDPTDPMVPQSSNFDKYSEYIVQDDMLLFAFPKIPRTTPSTKGLYNNNAIETDEAKQIQAEKTALNTMQIRPNDYLSLEELKQFGFKRFHLKITRNFKLDLDNKCLEDKKLFALIVKSIQYQMTRTCQGEYDFANSSFRPWFSDYYVKNAIPLNSKLTLVQHIDDFKGLSTQEDYKDVRNLQDINDLAGFTSFSASSKPSTPMRFTTTLYDYLKFPKDISNIFRSYLYQTCQVFETNPKKRLALLSTAKDYVKCIVCQDSIHVTEYRRHLLQSCVKVEKCPDCGSYCCALNDSNLEISASSAEAKTADAANRIYNSYISLKRNIKVTNVEFNKSLMNSNDLWNISVVLYSSIDNASSPFIDSLSNKEVEEAMSMINRIKNGKYDKQDKALKLVESFEIPLDGGVVSIQFPYCKDAKCLEDIRVEVDYKSQKTKIELKSQTPQGSSSAQNLQSVQDDKDSCEPPKRNLDLEREFYESRDYLDALYPYVPSNVDNEKKISFDHSRVCVGRLVNCEFCSRGVKWKNLETHHETCKEYPVQINCNRCINHVLPRRLSENHKCEIYLLKRMQAIQEYTLIAAGKSIQRARSDDDDDDDNYGRSLEIQFASFIKEYPHFPADYLRDKQFLISVAKSASVESGRLIDALGR